MSTIEEREAYLNNPFFTKHIYGDYTPFYITITVCTIFGVILFALNIIFGCCSKYKQYWEDRHTGNRFLVSLYTVSPHKNPPLDLSELQNVTIDYPSAYPVSSFFDKSSVSRDSLISLVFSLSLRFYSLFHFFLFSFVKFLESR